MSATPEEIHAGQAIYTPKTLAHYNLNVSGNHLDVGVGTGYFLDRCRFPTVRPRVALMDLNRDALSFASRRIKRYEPEVYARNVLEEIAFEGERFDSVGANCLLHRLPGDMATKARAFDFLMPLMNPGAVLFGATLLQGGVARGWAARRLMALYNSKGVFSNTQDDLETLTRELEKRFSRVSIETVDCAALFSARR